MAGLSLDEMLEGPADDGDNDEASHAPTPRLARVSLSERLAAGPSAGLADAGGPSPPDQAPPRRTTLGSSLKHPKGGGEDGSSPRLLKRMTLGSMPGPRNSGQRGSLSESQRRSLDRTRSLEQTRELAEAKARDNLKKQQEDDAEKVTKTALAAFEAAVQSTVQRQSESLRERVNAIAKNLGDSAVATAELDALRESCREAMGVVSIAACSAADDLQGVCSDTMRKQLKALAGTYMAKLDTARTASDMKQRQLKIELEEKSRKAIEQKLKELNADGFVMLKEAQEQVSTLRAQVEEGGKKLHAADEALKVALKQRAESEAHQTSLVHTLRLKQGEVEAASAAASNALRDLDATAAAAVEEEGEGVEEEEEENSGRAELVLSSPATCSTSPSGGTAPLLGTSSPSPSPSPSAASDG